MNPVEQKHTPAKPAFDARSPDKPAAAPRLKLVAPSLYQTMQRTGSQ